MLILTRKLGESIMVGEYIKVKVVGIKGNQVKLGIEAPPGTMVYREEIYAQIKEENQSAAATRYQDVSVIREFWNKWKCTETRRE